MKTFLKLTVAVGALGLAMSACGGGHKQETALTHSGIDPQNFNSEYNGKPTGLYTLRNEAGMEVCVTNFGGRIVSVSVPDREGVMRDVVLGFDSVAAYFPENHQTDFGAA
ncbi:MAG: galactose-1-epimerase, partial [Duncaniella sp.]|nr:galactose-1-epimerase [Duncaniella sp.]